CPPIIGPVSTRVALDFWTSLPHTSRVQWTLGGRDMADGHLIGYVRTSTSDQQAGLEAQLRDLKAAGCRKVFSEQASAVGERAQLETALDYCRDGDALVVTKLDRLTRSARHPSGLLDRLGGRGGDVPCLNIRVAPRA